MGWVSKFVDFENSKFFCISCDKSPNFRYLEIAIEIAALSVQTPFVTVTVVNDASARFFCSPARCGETANGDNR